MMRIATHDLRGKRAVVTGAASGIGLGIARRMAEAGASVIATDIDARRLGDELSRGSYGAAATVHPLDVADIAAVHSVFARIAEDGGIDIAVNNAGLAQGADLLATTAQMWHRMMAVNATGCFFCMQAAARAMIAAGGGRIVNISSHSATLGSAGRAAYAATKGAVNAMTRVAAVELASYGIRVNAIAPGPVATPHSIASHSPERRAAWLKAMPVARYAQAGEIGDIAVFLASPAADHITGQILAVDGGYSIAGLRENPKNIS
jgi:NAD(P)-dependent dehydrogenase (short-subunit alcohol dehydrogenase family)